MEALAKDYRPMKPVKHSKQMNLAVPKEVAEAVTTASRRRLMSKSEYARQAIITQLMRDGICPVAA
jgi:predicted HicB family RNase H-like nuclease